MAEVLLYGSIYDETASKFMEDVQDVIDSGDTELVVRINCNGGDVGLGWGLVTKFAEFKGSKKVKIDGKAYSMGAVFALFADEVESNDMAQAMFHRAGSYFENEEWYKAEGFTTMIDIANSGIKKAMKARLDINKFSEIMASKPATEGKNFKDLFSMDSRLNVFLDAKEMKAIGMVGKTIRVTPTKARQINARVMECAAQYQGGHKDMMIPEPSAEVPVVESNNENKEDMADKTVNTDLNQAAIDAAVTAERDRVNAWMKFHEVDPKTVQAQIASGATIFESQAVVADLMIKQNNPNREEAPTAETTTTDAPEGKDNPGGESEKLTETEAAQAKVNSLMGVGVEQPSKTEK